MSVPEEIREWEMVVELMDSREDMNENESEFIKKLYDNLDPYESFLEQMEGLAEGVNQEMWLAKIYEKYANEDEEAANEIYEDDN